MRTREQVAMDAAHSIRRIVCMGADELNVARGIIHLDDASRALDGANGMLDIVDRLRGRLEDVGPLADIFEGTGLEDAFDAVHAGFETIHEEVEGAVGEIQQMIDEGLDGTNEGDSETVFERMEDQIAPNLDEVVEAFGKLSMTVAGRLS